MVPTRALGQLGAVRSSVTEEVMLATGLEEAVGFHQQRRMASSQSESSEQRQGDLESRDLFLDFKSGSVFYW